MAVNKVGSFFSKSKNNGVINKILNTTNSNANKLKEEQNDKTNKPALTGTTARYVPSKLTERQSSVIDKILGNNTTQDNGAARFKRSLQNVTGTRQNTGKTTLFDEYNQLDKSVKTQAAKQMLNYKNAKGYLSKHWNDSYSTLNDERDEWQSYRDNAKQFTDDIQDKNKNLFSGFSSDIIKRARVIPQITSRDENDKNNKENDRILYDQYFGQGAYDDVFKNPNASEKAKQDAQNALNEIWADIDSGYAAEAAENAKLIDENKKAYEYMDSQEAYAEKKMADIARREEQYADYTDLMWKYSDYVPEKSFFKKNNQYREEYDRGTTGYSPSDSPETEDITNDVYKVYSFLGRGKEYEGWSLYTGGYDKAQVGKEYGYAMMMTDGSNGSYDEIGTFMNLYNKAMEEGREPEEAKAFLEGLQPSLQQRYDQFSKIAIAEYAREHPVLSTVGSVLLNVTDAYVDAARHVAHVLGDKSTEDPTSNWFAASKWADTATNAITNEIGGFGGKIYSNLVNTMSNVVRGLTTPGSSKLVKTVAGLGQFFMQVDQQQTYRYLDEYGYETAQKLAAIDAMFEVFEEFLPYETMLGSEGTNILLSVLANGLAEAGQEFTGATIFDELQGVLGGTSTKQDRVNEIYNEGYYIDDNGNPVMLSENDEIAYQQARVQATKEMWRNAVESGAAGFFGGSAGATYGVAMNAIENQKTNIRTGEQVMTKGLGKNANQKERTRLEVNNAVDLVEAAEKMKEGSESRKLAEKIREGMKTGEFNKAQIGKLARTIASESSNRIGEIAKGVLNATIKKEMEEKGVKDAGTLADIATREAMGEEVPMMERVKLDMNRMARDIAIEYTKGYTPEGKAVVKSINEKLEAEAAEEKEALATVKSIMETDALKEARTKRYQDIVKDAKVATEAEYKAAEGTKTGSTTEVIADGVASEIAGFEVVKEKNPETGKEERRLKVKLADNRTVDISQVMSRNLAAAQILEYAKQDLTQTGSSNFIMTLLKNADKTDGVTLLDEAMKIQWQTALGQVAQRTSLEAALERDIRTAAEQDRDKWDEDRLKNHIELHPGKGKGTYNGAEYGTVEFREAIKNLSRTEKNELLAALSFGKAIGVDITIDNDTSKPKIQGNFTDEGIYINLAGQFDTKGTRRSVLATLPHEITHWLEANSPKAYAELRSYVLQTLQGRGMNLQGALTGIMQDYANAGADLNIYGGIAELVAKSCEEMLTSEKFVKGVMESNPELYTNLQKAVNKVWTKVQTALNSLGGTQSRFAREMHDYLDKLSDLYMAAYEEAKQVKGTGEGTGASQKSVIELTDGTKIAVEDRNILDNKPEGVSESQYIYDYLTEHIGDKEIVDSTSDVVYLGDKLPSEYISSKYTKDLLHGNRKKLTIKNRTAGFILDAIKAAYNKSGPNAAIHTNKNAKYGVYKYNTRIAFPVTNKNGEITDYNAYTAQMIVNHTSKNVLDLYDVIDINKDTATGNLLKKESADGKTKVIRHQSDASNNLTQNNKKSNSQNSIQESEETFKALDIEPEYAFTYSDEQSAEAEKQIEARKDEYRKIIENPEFNGLQITKKNGQTEILTKSIRNGVRYQLSYYGRDGIANMHENYGETGVKNAVNENIHSMEELYNHLIRMNMQDDITMTVLQDEKTIREEADKTTQKQADKILKDSGEIAYAPVQYSFAGEQAEGEYGDFVREAYRMDQKGATDEEIREKTNCIRGYNGRWWYVLNNNDNKLTIELDEIENGEYYGLESIYKADELYKAYPLLKYIPVYFSKLQANTIGQTNTTGLHSITYNTDYLYMGKDSIIATLEHEIQHLIQLMESSNGGSNATFWKDMQDIARARIANNDRVIEEIYKKYGIDSSKELAFGIDFNDDGTIDESGLFPEEIEKVRKFTEEELNLYKNIEIDNQKWLKLIQGYRSPLNLYFNTVGEIEARAAEEKTSKETKLTYPGNAVTTEEYTGTATSRPGATLNEPDDIEHLFGGKKKSYSVQEALEHPKAQFSMQDTVEATTDGLLAVHNLEEDQLIKALQMGGFPMPSIAVIKAIMGHNKYGGISVVFTPRTIDPKANRNNKVYGGDAWTPTYPSVEYKVNGKVLNKLKDRIEKLIPQEVRNGLSFSSLDETNATQAINNNRGDYVKALENNIKLKLAYLNDKGIKIDYPMQEKQINNRFSNEEIKKILDILGEETVTKAHMESSRYIDEHPEIAETVRKVKSDTWEKEIGEKIKDKQTVLKMLKINPYAEGNDLGYGAVIDAIYGAYTYMKRGITQEVNERELKEKIESIIDQEDYENWLRNELSGIIEKKGIRNNKNYYTDYGNPRSWEALHDEETLENVVRIMKAETDKGSNAFFSQSEMLAVGTKNFKSLDEIRKHSGQLQRLTEEEYIAAKKEIIDGFGELMDEIADPNERNTFIARDRALEAMVDAVRTSKTADGIMRILRQWNGLRITEDMGKRIVDLVEKIGNLPTEYFEAKPQRAVGFDEIEKVIVPETVSEELLDALDERGIPYEIYNGTDEGRLEALNRQENAKFSIMDETEGDIRYWMMSVKPESLQTEAEKELLNHFKDVQTRLDLRNIQIGELKEKIRRLESKETLNKDEKRLLAKWKIQLENAMTVKKSAEEELGKIVGSEGYGRMMKRQNRIFNDFMYGKTQAEVEEEIRGLQTAADNIAREIAENKRIIDELSKKDSIKAVKEILEATKANDAAGYLKRKFNSSWTKAQLRTYIDPILALAAKQNLDDPELQQRVRELAEILVESDTTNTYETIQDLRGITITIGKGAQKELRATHRSINDIRDKLAGTGIKVRFGDNSNLDTDTGSGGDLRTRFPDMPEITNDLDAIDQFVDWVNGMRGQENLEFFEEKVNEAYAEVMAQAAAVAAAGQIYKTNDPKARQQIAALIDYIRGLDAKTEAAEKTLERIQKDIGLMTESGNRAAGLANVLTTNIGDALEYYDRTAKMALATAKKERNTQIIEQLKSENAQKIAKNNEEWRNLIERDKQAQRQAENNRVYRSRINTALKRTFNLLKNPKGMQNIPEYMQGLARELLETFVDNDLNEMRMQKITLADKGQLEEAKRLLEAWKKQDGEFNMADLNDAEDAVASVINMDLLTIYDGIAQLNGEIRGKNKLDTMTQRGEILRQVQEAVSEIYSAIRTEGKIQVNRRMIDVQDQAYRIATELNGKNRKEWTGKIGNVMNVLHKGIVSGNMTPEYFFRTIGNAGLTELWNNYHDAENRNGLELKKAQTRLAEIAEKHGYEKWDMKQKITLPIESGDVTLTLGQLMSLWATWKRENTLGPAMSEHLTKGGFYAEEDTRDGLLGRRTIEKKAHRVTEADMQRVAAMLTDEQLAFIDDVVGYMSTDMSELGNEASMAAYGIKMYKEGYYFPFQIWDGIRSRKSNDSGSAAAAQDRAFHPSFSKSRLHGANNALVIGDFMQTAADHIAGMINYATMGLANESLQKTLNLQLQENEDAGVATKRNVWTMMEEAYGQEAMQYLRELQKQLNGGAVKIDKTFYDKLISLFRKNAVAGSLSVALQQPLSYIRAAMMMNPKYLAQALNPATWKGSYKEMLAHSGVAVIKDMGRFDMNFGQSAREFLTPDGLESKPAKVWNAIEEYSTKLPELMDRMTWTRMWSAVKAEQKALHPDMDETSDEFLDLCGERFNDIMRRTQVYDSVLVKSANMRSQNPFMKTLTSFMAEPTLTLNVLADSVRMAKEGEAGGKAMLARAGATFILSAILQAAVKGLMGSGRTPDEKKTWLENFAYKYWYNFFNEIDPLQLVPGFSDAVTLLKGGELKDDAYGTIVKMVNAYGKIGEILSGGGYRAVEDSIGQLMQLYTGVPMKNLMRDGRAMWNWFIDQPYAERETSGAVLKGQAKDLFFNADNMIGVINTWLGDAGYDTSNMGYYEQIYNAKKRGDEQAELDLIDYLINGKGIKAETIESKVNSIAKKDESLSAEEKAEFLISQGSDSADDYIREQLKQGNMTAAEARKELKKAQPDKDENEIWWTVDRIEYAKETGGDTPGGYYYRLEDAINSNSANAIKAAVQELTAHGVPKDNVKKKLSDWKKAYLSATGNEKVRIKNALIMAYKALGYSETEANEIINKWK